MSSEAQTPTPPTPPAQSAFFRALNAPRYERQSEIRQYEETSGRALIVVHGPIAPTIITPFADAVNDVSRGAPLDLMLTSIGGDGETALRMASMCHGEREDFRIIVADMAASAATLLSLAAETIVMSDTSALGPIDPQVLMQKRLQYIPAKDIVAIVEDLEERTRDNPQAFELYVSLLADIDAIIYQTAKAAIRRTEELVPELLRLQQNPPSAEAIKRHRTTTAKPCDALSDYRTSARHTTRSPSSVYVIQVRRMGHAVETSCSVRRVARCVFQRQRRHRGPQGLLSFQRERVMTHAVNHVSILRMCPLRPAGLVAAH